MEPSSPLSTVERLLRVWGDRVSSPLVPQDKGVIAQDKGHINQDKGRITQDKGHMTQDKGGTTAPGGWTRVRTQKSPGVPGSCWSQGFRLSEGWKSQFPELCTPSHTESTASNFSVN